MALRVNGSKPNGLFLLCRCWRRSGFGWLRISRRRPHTLQYGIRASTLLRHNRKSDGRDHKDDGRPSGRARKSSSGAAWAECSLATLASKGSGDIAAFTALQQYDNDEKETNNDVNNRK